MKHRLLTIAHSYAVGLNRRLAHEFARVGQDRWEVTAVAPRYFHGLRDLRPVCFQSLNNEPCRVKAVSAYLTRQVHCFWYGSSLRQTLAQSWDVVHCWEEPFVFAGWQIAQWARPGSRLVFATFQNQSKNYVPPFNWLEISSMRRAAGWIPFGQTSLNVLANRPGYADRPFRMIPPGIDTDLFQPNRAQGAAVRRSLSWATDGPPVIGYLGRFIPEKGLALLMNALDRQTTPWRALFVGAGPLEADLRQWANRNGDRVRICSNVGHAEVPHYLNAMDVLCAPSQTTPRWREQFGRMLIEAFACGVPVIGSDSGEIPHVMGETGIVVGEADSAGWERAVGELLENNSLRERLGAAGRERAIAKFDWSVIGRLHLEFFERLLGGSSSC